MRTRFFLRRRPSGPVSTTWYSIYRNNHIDTPQLLGVARAVESPRTLALEERTFTGPGHWYKSDWLIKELFGQGTYTLDIEEITEAEAAEILAQIDAHHSGNFERDDTSETP